MIIIIIVVIALIMTIMMIIIVIIVKILTKTTIIKTIILITKTTVIIIITAVITIVGVTNKSFFTHKYENSFRISLKQDSKYNGLEFLLKDEKNSLKKSNSFHRF